MNHGMSGYLEWVGFDLTRVMYGDLFDFFKIKNEKLIACGDDQGLAVESDIDLIAWRYNVAFGVPYREHQLLLEECSRLERDFRAALSFGESERAYSIYADLGRMENKRDCFVKSYMGLKK
ncbi:hypothetical protein EBQ34_14905 [Vandammella animalimorsus]|uniref:Uncharacterized protein n=2 Tax=Vandammella animalimorsus TaxID=2029117 RepID=A0A3M6QX73_9BURK|nr:hypothetical protein EBQ34_14905 [Vandammella animalimorsus]